MTINLNITPMKSFIGRVLPLYRSEFFLLENFTKYNKSMLIEKYIEYIEKNAGTTDINYGVLLHMFIIYDKVLTRNIPVVNKAFLGYKVIKLVETERNITIKIEYTFD